MTPNRRTFLIAVLAFAAGLVLLWTARHLVSTGFIEIVEAEYGIPGRTCTAGAVIKRYVSSACDGFRPRCLVSVSTGWCGDPAVGVVKTLTVDYRCGATRKRASAQDNSALLLVCP
jgi:hypothetical protein